MAALSTLRHALTLLATHPLARDVMWLLWRTGSSVSKLLYYLLAPDLLLSRTVAVTLLQLLDWLLAALRERDHAGWRPALFAGRKAAELARSMRQSKTFEEWWRAAQQLDDVEGNTAWRQEPRSPFYEEGRLNSRMATYARHIRHNAVKDLMFHLRGGLLRKHWGLGHPELFRAAHAGTKFVLERYLSVVSEALQTVAACERVPVEERLAFFRETRHAFGRSALLLSGGGSLGFHHLGVLRALMLEKLMPRVISGSSAGAIVTALVAVRTDEEVLNMFHSEGWNLDFFRPLRPPKYKTGGTLWEALFNVWVALRTWLPWQGAPVMDVEHLAKAVRDNVGGDITFAEAYDRTGRIVNITVSPTNSSDFPRILNYLTAPHVLVWSAAVASCAIPGVFEPVELLAKDADGSIRPYYPEGLRWSDGSLENDLPMARLAELFNVNNFIVSQVNPHAGLFAGFTRPDGSGKLAKTVQFLKREINSSLANLSDWLLRMPFKVLGLRVVSLVTQKYEGDITILPRWGMRQLAGVLNNPTWEGVENAILCGERATWPNMAHIRMHCVLEFVLEKCVHQLRRSAAAKGRPTLGRVPSFISSRSNGDLAKLATAASSSGSSSASRRRPPMSPPPDGFYSKHAPGLPSPRLSLGSLAARATAMAAASPAASGSSSSAEAKESEDTVDADQLRLLLPRAESSPCLTKTQERQRSWEVIASMPSPSLRPRGPPRLLLDTLRQPDEYDEDA